MFWPKGSRPSPCGGFGGGGRKIHPVPRAGGVYLRAKKFYFFILIIHSTILSSYHAPIIQFTNCRFIMYIDLSHAICPSTNHLNKSFRQPTCTLRNHASYHLRNFPHICGHRSRCRLRRHASRFISIHLGKIYRLARCIRLIPPYSC